MLGSFSPGSLCWPIVSTMVLAPMIEELLFRGIVQRWLDSSSPGLEAIPSSPASRKCHVDLLADDLLPHGDLVESRACPDDGGSASRPRGSSEPAGAATSAGLPIVLTSLAFASMHATQWPAPIAIFLLSMALGALYHRTGSLLAVITMHATFNGFSTLLLLLEALSRQIEPDHAAQQTAQWLGSSYLVTCL